MVDAGRIDMIVSAVTGEALGTTHITLTTTSITYLYLISEFVSHSRTVVPG